MTVCTATTEDFRIVWDARSISSNKAWCFREEYARGKQTILKVFRVSPELAAETKGQTQHQLTSSRANPCFILARLPFPMMGELS